MKEVVELRIDYGYAHLLFKEDEGKNLGTTVKIVKLTKDDPRYDQIPIIEQKVKKKYKEMFFYGWSIKRLYSKKELADAVLFHLMIETTFEPTGEECGTVYDETVACKLCGANRKQCGPLILKESSIPKKDIVRTIAGEVVVSSRFASVLKQKGLKGVLLKPVCSSQGHVLAYYQLFVPMEVELSQNTIVGVNPFDLSVSSLDETYQCPHGDTIGLNLLSEPYILQSSIQITDCDLWSSRQKIGVTRGLLRPESLYLCSSAFRKMVKDEKLKGFDFEIAHVV